jgi:hypothetical protein
MLNAAGKQDKDEEHAVQVLESNEELPTIDEQLERVGIGNFQYFAILAFVLFIMTDGMEILLSNIVYRAMPRKEWGMTNDDRARLISTAYLGFVFGKSQNHRLLHRASAQLTFSSFIPSLSPHFMNAGAVFGGYFADVYGRKPLIYFHSLIFLPAAIWCGKPTHPRTRTLTQPHATLNPYPVFHQLLPSP